MLQKKDNKCLQCGKWQKLFQEIKNENFLKNTNNFISFMNLNKKYSKFIILKFKFYYKNNIIYLFVLYLLLKENIVNG
jgi:hypothetical protein